MISHKVLYSMLFMTSCQHSSKLESTSGPIFLHIQSELDLAVGQRYSLGYCFNEKNFVVCDLSVGFESVEDAPAVLSSVAKSLKKSGIDVFFCGHNSTRAKMLWFTFCSLFGPSSSCIKSDAISVNASGVQFDCDESSSSRRSQPEDESFY